jgi:hypothetical protein
MGGIKNAYNISVGKPEKKRPLRWEYNIRDWMHLAEDWVQWWALVNMVMTLQVQ